MKIKIILQHYCSNTDVNGNRYWMHKATNTNTSHSLWWESPHSSNAESAVRNAGYEWRDIMSCGDVGLPIREYNTKKRLLEKYDNLMYDSCQDPAIVKAINHLRRKKQ